MFARNLGKTERRRGSSEVGFGLTDDGRYNLQYKRLCSLATPYQLSDVVNLDNFQRKLKKLRDDIPALKTKFKELEELTEDYI